jgi:hypothetical protein
MVINDGRSGDNIIYRRVLVESWGKWRSSLWTGHYIPGTLCGGAKATCRSGGCFEPQATSRFLTWPSLFHGCRRAVWKRGKAVKACEEDLILWGFRFSFRDEPTEKLLFIRFIGRPLVVTFSIRINVPTGKIDALRHRLDNELKTPHLSFVLKAS